MESELWLLDTNVLLRWFEPQNPAERAVDALLSRRDLPCYTTQNLAEFWNTCTRPEERNGYGFSIDETERRVRLMETKFRHLPESVASHDEWRRIVVAHQVRGVQVYDARLVAVMFAHNVKHILTFNDKDFTRYPNIEPVNPQSLVDRQNHRPD